MVIQTDFPESWSVDCANKGVKVEVLVSDSSLETQVPQGGTNSWIEIPTTNVEVYEEKDRISDIYTLAKVEFPAMWEGVSVSQLIQGFNDGDSISYIKISFWHESSEQWIIKHFGFASGVGSSAPGVMKMWVYDFAEFVRGIPAGFFFDNVFVDDVVNIVTKEVNEQTPGIAIGSKVLFSYDPQYGLDFGARFEQRWSNSVHDVVADGLEPREVWSFIINDPFAETVDEQGNATKALTAAKTFKENRHTIEDVLEWLCERIGARWWFEPTDDGAVLVIDKQKESRLFAQRSVMNTVEADAASVGITLVSLPDWYDRITVIANTALYDINPINTVIVRGDLGNSLSQILFNDDQVDITEPGSGAYGLINDVFSPSRSFPYVKARASPLYNRALKATGNSKKAELNAQILDTDDTTIEEAKASATEALLELLSEQAEGNVIIYGNPKLTVFDSIHVFPTCNTIVDDDSQVPVVYEVEATRHKKTAGDIYKTEIYVSVFIEEDDIEFVEERMATANEQVVK